MPVARAISSYDRSSTSRIATTSRNDSGGVAIAGPKTTDASTRRLRRAERIIRVGTLIADVDKGDSDRLKRASARLRFLL